MNSGGFHDRPRRARRGRGWVFLLPLILALAVRVIHVAEVANGPFPHLQVWAQSDMHFFDRWARSIDAGDWWTHAPMRPYHVWHDSIARTAYADAGYRASSFDAAIGRSMWGAWLGQGRFYQDPGYPYLLALVYAVSGSAVPAVWYLQSLLSLGCVALVFSLTRRLYGSRAALYASCAAALYGPLMFYEPVLLRCVLISFLGLSALRVAVAALDSSRPSRWLGAGIVAGVAYLVKSTALLPAGIAMAAGVLVRRRMPVHALRFAAAFLLGWLLAISPASARNLHEGVSPWSGAATGVISFVRHNYAGFEPGRGSGVSPKVAEIMVESGGRGWPALRDTIGGFSTAFGWPRLLVSKFAAFWTPYEIPNNVNYAYWKLLAPRSAALTIGFVFVVLAAALGLSVGFRRDPARALLVTTIAASVLTCVVFFNLSRFRVPIACMMMPLAGAGVAEVVTLFGRRRQVGSLSRMIAALCVAGALVGYAGARSRQVVRIADYGVANRIAIHMARVAVEQGRTAQALDVITKQLATEPPVLARLRPGGPAVRVSATDAKTAGTFADVHSVAARLYADEGLGKPALRHRRRAALYERLGRGQPGKSGGRRP